MVSGIAPIWKVIYHFLLVVCSNSVSVCHNFQDITTFTAYVTSPFVSVIQFKLQATHTFQFTCNYIVCNTPYSLQVRKASNDTINFKMSQVHRYWWHIQVPHMFFCYSSIVAMSCTVSKILSVTSKKSIVVTRVL